MQLLLWVLGCKSPRTPGIYPQYWKWVFWRGLPPLSGHWFFDIFGDFDTLQVFLLLESLGCRSVVLLLGAASGGLFASCLFRGALGDTLKRPLSMGGNGIQEYVRCWTVKGIVVASEYEASGDGTDSKAIQGALCLIFFNWCWYERNQLPFC